MAFELAPLPFGPQDLEPHMSAQTLSFHHGKHHQAYVTNLNNLIKDTPLADKNLVEIMRATVGDEAKIAVFNNAAQVWNHDFFWKSLKAQGGGAPTGRLAKLINEAFGSLDGFKEQFKQAGLSQFGSGWVWLVEDQEGLRIVKTPNAMNPLVMGLLPLITCDVWEHAYYLDYQNKRPDFIQTFLDHVVNWDFAEENLS